jgi:hypothetical protein
VSGERESSLADPHGGPAATDTLRNDDDYLLPHPRLEFFKKIPIYSLAAKWNAAGVLRFYQNRTTFKIALKDHLLNEIVDN